LREKENIYIIGAGVAGLIAAFELEKRGYAPIVLEASDRVGGKLKTDQVNGYNLDHGFQVLLTAYPEARQYLDYEKLKLQKFDPGALIFKGDKIHEIADPLRNISMIPKMMFSPVGNVSDKLKLFFLTQKVKNRKVTKIFQGSRKTTIEFLSSKNFSYKIIEDFFKPFFGGIFLDNNLKTSSKMFKFVFKMFSEGHAAVPENGIQAIPFQLKDNLTATTFRFNSKIRNIIADTITLENGEKVKANKIIVAANPHTMIRGLWNQKLNYNSVINLYFETNKSFIEKPLIGLVPGSDSVINNFHFQSSLGTKLENKKHLLSATVVGSQDLDNKLIEKASKELKKYSGDPAFSCNYLKGYKIDMALPRLKDLDYTVHPSTTKLTDHIYLAGDYMLYPSLNAAMTSGRLVAEAVASSL
jgi:protoporphyrinogen oxidase